MRFSLATIVFETIKLQRETPNGSEFTPCTEFTLVDVSDIFYFFLLGGGEGGVRGAGEVGGSFFFFFCENPGRGGAGRQGAGRVCGRIGEFSFGGGA